MDEILDKKVGIDVDGDKKPDINLDIKSILIVGGFLISGAMSYSNLKQEIDNMFQGNWQTSIGLELKGKVLGIIGLGKIGSQVAKIERKPTIINKKAAPPYTIAVLAFISDLMFIFLPLLIYYLVFLSLLYLPIQVFWL